MESPFAELARRLGDELRRRGATVSVAESCTAGALGAAITSAAGASEYFVGGILAYSVRAKQEVLGIAPALLQRHGPVSSAVAAAMARRIRLLARTDFALSVTGNAGPTADVGGQPVGTVFVGLCGGHREGPEFVRIVEHRFTGERSSVQQQAVRAALQMLVDALLERRPAAL